MKRTEKVISKYYRIKMTDDIRSLLELLPIRNVVESQVGNYVYSGYGEICVGSSYHPVSLKIQLVQKILWVYISAPRARVGVKCKFVPRVVERALNEAISKSLN